MAAYAALVSLANTIEQIEHHPRPPISLDKEQVESLSEKVTFLQEFLEGYSHVGYTKEADALESRIADAAYAAEDIIEFHIVDQVLAASTSASTSDHRKITRFFNCSRGLQKASSHRERISSVDLYQGLQKVIEDMDSIKKEVMQFKVKKGVPDPLLRNLKPTGSFSSTTPNTTVGFDDVLHEFMDKLTGQQSGLQVIPVVGMGGIGKTTLAKNIYAKPLIKGHFDIRAWATISQEYNTREILREVLCQVKKDGTGDLSEMSENQLGERLYKHLFGRRYLIVMDDLWSIEVWEKIRISFPNYNNGSRIIVTTRLSNLAFQLTDSYSLEMKFLNEHCSWNLFSKIVFEEEAGCPLELEEIGKEIVQNCKGLPLSIVVVGGLLAKSKRTRKCWKDILDNLNSIVNLEDNERSLQILYMSYNNLPVYLKPCFLYMGAFKEDSKVHVSKLVKLWLAEGFLKSLDDTHLKEVVGSSIPHKKRSLEEVGEECLQELVDRNLILVEERNYNGKVKFCKIHDLLRDLCLREARKAKFLCVLGEQSSLNIPQDINTKRRLCIHDASRRKIYPLVLDALQPFSVARSFMGEHSVRNFSSFTCRLLRVYSTGYLKRRHIHQYAERVLFQQVNLRYIALVGSSGFFGSPTFPSSISILWNLQTLIIDFSGVVCAPVEIWKMHQLRHVKVNYLTLPDPPTDDIIVLENLQTLGHIINFTFGEEVVERIPNIKKLRVAYYFCVNYNLGHLNALESLDISLGLSNLKQILTLPQNLKKLTLTDYYKDGNWEDVLEKIGSLPLLQKLKLYYGTFKGGKWETVEGQFPSLKFLRILCCDNLKYWTTDSSHFPRLEHLVLLELKKLKEIPPEIGEIETLQSIQLVYCSESAKISAEKILKEQEELYGEVRLQLTLI